MGVLIGWFISRQSDDTSSRSAPSQRQIDQICEIDQCVSSAVASLHAYEKRILVGKHLGENGQVATKDSASGPGPEPTARSPSAVPPSGGMREPLDGKTLLSIKREADEHIWECTNALTRATAFLDEETVLRAQEMVEALVETRETLEAQEAEDTPTSEEMTAHVAALHRTRTRFLDTARHSLRMEALSDEATERVQRLSEQAFSSSQLPRPYMMTGVRIPEERF